MKENAVDNIDCSWVLFLPESALQTLINHGIPQPVDHF